jgi:hypothetical protein
MKARNTVVVYWAPFSLPDWNNLVSMLWDKPTPVMRTLPKAGPNSYLACQAASNLFANTFVLTHPQDLSATFSNPKNPTSESTDTRFVVHVPSEVGAHTVALDTSSWIFFCEEDLEASMTPPFMHQTLDKDYGYIPAGKFNISRWFRPFNLTYQLWAGVTEMKVRKGDPAMYLTFHTDKKVILKRFDLTRDLYRMGIECSELKHSLPRMHLEMLYNVFTKSLRNKKTLELIQDNLLE